MSGYQEKKLQGIPTGRKYISSFQLYALLRCNRQKHNLKRQTKHQIKDMAGMVELSDQECKTTMINMPEALMLKPAGFGTNGLCRQWCHHVAWKNKREMLEINHMVTHMQNALMGLLVDWTEMKNLWATGSIDICGVSVFVLVFIKNQKAKKTKAGMQQTREQTTQGLCGPTTKGVTYV